MPAELRCKWTRSLMSCVLCVFMWTLVSQMCGVVYLEGSELPCLKYTYERLVCGSKPGCFMAAYWNISDVRRHLSGCLRHLLQHIGGLIVCVCVCFSVSGCGRQCAVMCVHTRVYVLACLRCGVVSISGHLWCVYGRSKCLMCI